MTTQHSTTAQKYEKYIFHHGAFQRIERELRDQLTGGAYSKQASSLLDSLQEHQQQQETLLADTFHQHHVRLSQASGPPILWIQAQSRRNASSKR